MSEKKFSKKHEWVSIEGDVATVGITKHATELLGDIVFAEVPDPGKLLKKRVKQQLLSSQKQPLVMFTHRFLERLQKEIKQ